MTDAPQQIPVDFAKLQETQLFRRRKRVYESNAVDELVERVLASYDRICEELSRLQSEVEQQNQEIERYREFDGKLSNVLMHAETVAAGIRGDAEREAADRLKRAQDEADGILSKAREEKELLRQDVAGLKTLRSELTTTYRAFLLAAFELVDQNPFYDESPPADVPETAPSPDNRRNAAADADVDLEVDF